MPNERVLTIDATKKLTAQVNDTDTAIVGRGLTMTWTNVPIGNNALSGLTSGTNNVAIGESTATVLVTGSQCLYLGASTQASASDAANEIALGYNVTGKGSNTSTIGNTSITDTRLRGNALHVGNEANADMYVVFRTDNSSTPANLPGLKYYADRNVLQWSNGSDAWQDFAPSTPSVISPSETSATLNNYAPTGLATANLVRFSDSSAVAISGFNGYPLVPIKYFVNVGSTNVTLKHQSTSSSADNRIDVPGGADLVLLPDDSVVLYYDDTNGYWRVM
jgi:hypothetical protein